MTAIIWDAPGKRVYEAGVDRGVLYLTNGTGVPWNGLISVSENSTGNSFTPLYYDGVKYLDNQVLGDYSAVITAYTYPDEFSEYEGIRNLGGGLFADNQVRNTFGLSYRTLIGNDLEALDFGYKLHIVYSLAVVRQNVDYISLSDSVEPVEFSWQVSGIPQLIPGNRPTAHFILDSRLMAAETLAIIESILYGGPGVTPRLPTITELLILRASTSQITIVDNGNGTWTAIGPDSLITMLSATEFQITEANATFINATTYSVSST